tara:strand:+ start:686 stop:841 length:156 start_codon:yes stop_codon:yes gene_type:complete
VLQGFVGSIAFLKNRNENSNVTGIDALSSNNLNSALREIKLIKADQANKKV